MAMHVVALDWNDIRSMLRLCSNAFVKDFSQFASLDAARIRLVESAFAYTQEWAPETEIDDRVPLPLIADLQSFSELLTAAESSPVFRETPGMTFESMRGECQRLRQLLSSAIGSPDDAWIKTASMQEE